MTYTDILLHNLDFLSLLTTWQNLHTSSAFHGLQNAADGLSTNVSVDRHQILCYHFHIMYASIRHVHRQCTFSLHLGVVEFFYVVETHVSVALSVDEAHAHRVFVGGDGGED